MVVKTVAAGKGVAVQEELLSSKPAPSASASASSSSSSSAAAAVGHSFGLSAYTGNPEAVKISRRYVDEDLNRCFSLSGLGQSRDSTYESRRAAELDSSLGPKSSMSPKTDLLIDVHTTTSNVGTLLIHSRDDLFTRRLAAFLVHESRRGGGGDAFVPTVRLCEWLPDGSGEVDFPFCPTLGRSGFTWE